MKDYLKTWNVMRLIRLVMGVAILAQGIIMRDWSFMIIGSVLSLMPLLNLGCCSAGSCNTPTFRNTKMKESKNIKYEEVH